MKNVSLFALGLIAAMFSPIAALADSDSPYAFGSTSQVFDNNYATYKTNQGVSTNVLSEILPINPFGNEGRLKLENRDVPTLGTGGARLEDARTGFQIDYNF